MSRTQRIYLVRGLKPELPYVEVARDGAQVTLNVAPPNWPFPRFRTFSTNELIYAGGPAEPVPLSKSRELS